LLGLFVVAIAAMLLVPLPTVLIDFLLVINISFSVVLLLAGLYMQNALALLAFPSLLLLTTLFRLGLNVASTRLILSQANAGQVIQAFGSLLIRGEVMVGLMIFTIITVVNFIVIARGASRVSEVAARFALDALPGKQLAIDSDLRAGVITAPEAQRRREDLRKESQLYGSMDGAMRFVQGDAIAGFFIIFINIVGGIYLGVSNGLNFSDAIQTYTVLTVGDALVSQIPALLISICAGMVVTRVSQEENSTLSSDLASQLLNRPGTILFTGALLMGLALLPGIPPLPFLCVGACMIGGSYFLGLRGDNPESPVSSEKLLALPGSKGELKKIDDDRDDESTLVISLDAGLLFKLYKMNSQRYRNWWAEFRNDYYNETGVRLPDYRVIQDELCAPSTYSISVSGTQVETGTILVDSVLVEVNPDSAEMLGLPIVMETEHPFGGHRVFWSMQSPALRRVVESASIRSYDFMEFVLLKCGVFFNNFPEEVLTLTEVHGLLKQIDRRYPGLLSEAFNKEYINVARMTELLQALVREGVNIKETRQILEAVASYCSSFAASMLQEQDFDLQDLVSYVRINRKRQIVSRLLSVRRTLKVFTLAVDVEEILEGAQMDSRSLPLSLEPETFENLASSLQQLFSPILRRGLMPVSVLCRSELRSKVLNFVRNFNSTISVITFEELDPMVRVEQVGVWSI
jgi:type III secretion protein V